MSAGSSSGLCSTERTSRVSGSVETLPFSSPPGRRYVIGMDGTWILPGANRRMRIVQEVVSGSGGVASTGSTCSTMKGAPVGAEPSFGGADRAVASG